MAASSTRAIFFALGANTGIAVQAQMAPQTSAEALVAAINRVEHAIRTTSPQARRLDTATLRAAASRLSKLFEKNGWTAVQIERHRATTWCSSGP
jgi:DNA-binding LytR/AlgR family response regulator